MHEALGIVADRVETKAEPTALVDEVCRINVECFGIGFHPGGDLAEGADDATPRA